MGCDSITVILPRGTADAVMEAAKKAGAKGGTIYLARGTGAHEARTFFGLTIESGREVLLILSPESDTDRILSAIIEAAHLDEPGSGIAFVTRVSKLVGLDHRSGIEDFGLK